MPPVMTWTRLEPYARSTALDSGLRAEVRDPLWMLGRQWQLGEWWGEDAGSPVQVRVRMDCTPLTRYLPGGIPDSWYGAGSTAPTAAGQRLDPSVPLEAVVEREAVRIEGAFAPKLAAEAGLHFLRVLASNGGQAHRAAIVGLVPLQGVESAVDESTQRFLSLMVGRVPDGALLATVLRAAATPAVVDTLRDPYKTRVTTYVEAWKRWLGTLAATERARVENSTTPFLKWYDASFLQPGSTSGSAWVPGRLEYELAVAAPSPAGEVLLTAAEYVGGHLDWYAFDTLAKGSIGATRADLVTDDVTREKVRLTLLPTPLRYPGMPAGRYWEFEDARVDFGAIAAGTQQLAHLLLIEFALVAGDDWWIVPVDMPVGGVATTRWLVVTDTFGERTLVSSARQADDTAGDPGTFSLFRLAEDTRPVPGTARATPDVFLLPPTLGHSMHGEPLEEVLLLRDELANMAWAVERIVESPIGEPLNRTEVYNRALPPPGGGGSLATGETMLRYRLATDVPPHWVPLLPRRERVDAPPVVLRRGRPGIGRILQPPLPAGAELLIAEEEVPRAGVRVTRAFQYARWIDGSTRLWIGRRKTVGRGEGSSGLRFDVLERPDEG